MVLIQKIYIVLCRPVEQELEFKRRPFTTHEKLILKTTRSYVDSNCCHWINCSLPFLISVTTVRKKQMSDQQTNTQQRKMVEGVSLGGGVPVSAPNAGQKVHNIP